MSDSISRQAAIDALKKHEIELPVYAPREVDVFWDDAIDCCVSEIEDLPSVQPQRKRGAWMGTVCSACGAMCSYGFDSNYCPNCGAEMEVSD